MSFSVISQFFGGCPKFPLFDNLAQKRAPKNTMNIGVSAKHFWKTDARHEMAIFGQKTQIQKFQLSFFCVFLLLQQQKNKKSETPIFMVF